MRVCLDCVAADVDPLVTSNPEEFLCEDRPGDGSDGVGARGSEAIDRVGNRSHTRSAKNRVVHATCRFDLENQLGWTDLKGEDFR